MIDLGIRHHFSAGVYAKQMRLPAHHYAETHEHKYDHLSILASGDVTVEIDSIATDHTGPAVVHIAAGKKHRITAKTDSVWFCVHATDVSDPDLVDQVLIKE